MTATITISGYTFTVPSPFAAGHVCSGPEAEVLNQKFRENVRANMARRVEDTTFHSAAGMNGTLNQDAYMQGLQSEINAYAATYSFGGPDPSEAEALVIATQITRNALKAAGKNVSDYSKSHLSKMAAVLLAGPAGGEIRIMARDRVNALQAAAKKEAERLAKEAQA